MRNKIFWSLLLVIVLMSACKTPYLYYVTPMKKVEMSQQQQGLYYALPKNTVVIEIAIEETANIKGEFASYAEKYLGLKGVNLVDITTFEIVNIAMNVESSPDENQYYLVSPVEKEFNKNLLLELSESGLIENVEFGKNSASKVVIHEKIIEKRIVEKQLNDSMYEKLNIFSQNWGGKTTEQRAKELADMILKSKENRIKIISGFQEIAYDQGTVKYMYEQLLALENEYIKMFTGTVQKTIKHYRYTYTPDNTVFSASVPLFRFSKKKGIVGHEYPYGENIYLQVDRNTSVGKINSTVGSFEEQDKNELRGFYYRIPESAKFTVRQGKIQRAEASFMISQFGVTTYLPKSVKHIEFYPETGAIKSIQTK